MTIRVLAGGQSNVLGRALLGRNWNLLSASIRVWNNINPMGAVGSAFVTPAEARSGGTFVSTNRQNFGVWFCDRLARHSFDSVDMTLVGWEGREIDYWRAGRETDSMLDQTVNVWTATGQAPANVFLWHQGENDRTQTLEYYGGRFDQLLADLESGGVIDQNTIVLVGGIARETKERSDFNDAVLSRVSPDPRVVFVDSFGLRTDDGVHFDAHSLYRLGASKYFSAYLFAQARARL